MNENLVASCVWKATPALILSLAKKFGDPTDSYVNGSQVWLRDDGPGEITIEYRLHPVPNYKQPDDIEVFDVFPLSALGYSDNDEVAELPAPLVDLWDGLEAFTAYGDEIEPQPLNDCCTNALGISPDAFGLVNHQLVGDAWERSNRTVSITAELLKQLQS